VVNEKDQQLFIVEVVASGILALIPVDEGFAYYIVGPLFDERQLVNAVPCPTAMNVQGILFCEHEPLIFHPLRDEAETDTFILLLGKRSLQ
jgi:hypothetical protein